MCEAIKNSGQAKHKYEHVHCPACGGTDVKLIGGGGKFVGNVGGMIVRHSCESCDSAFTIIVTGDEFFPDRGFGFIKKDLNILFGKSA